MAISNAVNASEDERAVERKIDAAGWGVLFVWIGVALLAHLGWGIGLIGVGVITIGAQAWRKRFAVKVDRFALVIGTLFVIVGIWNLFDLRVDVVPLLFIAAGVGLLASTWRSRRESGHSPGIGRPAPPRA